MKDAAAAPTGRLIFLAGPSCMGKGTLLKTLKKFNRPLWRRLQRIALYNSRPPRPGETDGVEFRFRTRAQIEAKVRRKDLLALEVRGDLHALNVRSLHKTLARGDALIIDSPFLMRSLRAHSDFPNVPVVSVMLAPLSREEILFFKSNKNTVVPFANLVADLMRRKLLRRARRQKNILSLPDLEEIEVRARNAALELKEAHLFDHVLVNHEGGDNEYWSSFYHPIGDPRKTLDAFVEILAGRTPAWAEKWEPDLVP
jgi:guanylate kinase